MCTVPADLFDFDYTERAEAWEFLLKKLEDYYEHTDDLPVSPELNREQIRNYITRLSFDSSRSCQEAIEHVINGLKQFTVHTPHPQYFGLFNPRSNFPGIMADTITATFNPQLAAWSHAPFAVEVENRIIRELGKRFGYPPSSIDGTFTSGGAEANQTALLCALQSAFPRYESRGLHSLDKTPVIYVSAESHHSMYKAAKIAGLGTDAIRVIPVNNRLQLDTGELQKQIKLDLKQGYHPLMITATMGTTGSGAIDKIGEIYETAVTHNIWLHADAAYGGAVVLTDRFQGLVEGIHLADSITFDAHKWMSVPMSAGLFITRHTSVLSDTFHITTDYMPKEANELPITDPYSHSMQWSRRFTGLKVYLSLLIFGWKGYENVIEHHVEMGNLLKAGLKQSGWVIFNQSKLPVICFGKEMFKDDPNAAIQFNKKIISSGNAWLSVYKIQNINTLRVCITNYKTDETDIDQFLDILNSIP